MSAGFRNELHLEFYRFCVASYAVICRRVGRRVIGLSYKRLCGSAGHTLIFSPSNTKEMQGL